MKNVIKSRALGLVTFLGVLTTLLLRLETVRYNQAFTAQFIGRSANKTNLNEST